MSCSEWKEVKLSDIAQYVSNKIETSMINKDNYISTENMLPNKGGVTIATNLPNTKKVNASLDGDILISNIRPYFKKIWYCDYPCGVSTDVLIIRTKDNNVFNKFLYYFLSQDKFFDFMVGTSKGTKMPRGDKNAIMSYQLKLPPIKEQKVIVKLFESIDEKIKLNNEMNNTLEEIAQGIFKHWFVDFEFPNENGEPYKSSGGKFVESELGMIPEGWKASNVLENIEEYSIKNKEGKNYPVLSVTSEGRFVNTSEQFSEETYEFYNKTVYSDLNKIKKYKIIYKNSVGYNPSRANIGSIAMLNHVDVGLISPIYKVFRLKSEKLLSSYFTYYMKNPNFIKNIEHYSSGTTRQNFDIKCFSFFEIIVPSLNIQKLFEEKIKIIEDVIQENNKQINTLTKLRDTLLPKLMSGEIRIPEAEEAVESCLQKNN